MAHRAVNCRCNLCGHKWEAVIPAAEANPKVVCPKCRPGTRNSTKILKDNLPKLGGENPPEPLEAFRPDPPPPPPREPCGCGEPDCKGHTILDCTVCEKRLTCDIRNPPEDTSACPRYKPEPAPPEDLRCSELLQEFTTTYDHVTSELARQNPHSGVGVKARCIITTGFMICDRLDALLELMQEPEQPIPDPVEQKTLAIAREQERRRLASEATSSTNTG